jgi:hypothetical protein
VGSLARERRLVDLYAFTQWLRGRGLPESHLPVYRRGAESLLRGAAEGPLRAERIGETIHALTLAGASARTIANLQRIGEALLQFQEEANTTTPPLAEPIEEVRPSRDEPASEPLVLDDPDDAFLPVAKPMPPGGPEPAPAPRVRPEAAAPKPVSPSSLVDALVAERRAARAPTVTADLPAAIEEEPVTDAARGTTGAEEIALDLVAPRSAEPPPPASPPAATRPPRTTGDLVRCPKCGRMQPRRAEATCATCFAPFPHAISSAGDAVLGPGGAGRPDASPARRSWSSRVIALVVFAAAGLIGAMVGRQAVTGCAERFGARPVPAVGAYRVDHLGLTIDFPPGWRHLTREDKQESLQGIAVRVSTFARGGSVRRPDHGLQLAVLPLVGGFTNAPSLPDDEFVRFLGLSAQGAAKNLMGHGAAWLAQGCEAVRRDARRLGRCRGEASKSGETWHLTIYLVLGDDRVVFAVFGTEGDPEATRSESETIAASLRP